MRTDLDYIEILQLIEIARFVLFTVELDSNTVEPLIRTPKGQSEVSVLERCPYKRGHYDNVAFITPLTVLRVQ